MSFLPFALSLSSTFTKIGAIAAFAALVGIAMLSLLVFSQARELKRLREWAGRAPERAADLEQRVTAAAAVRVPQQAPPGQPPRVAPAPAGAAAAGNAPATRVVATPIPTPATAVPAAQALAASGAPAAPAAPAVAAPAAASAAAQPRPAGTGSPTPVGAPASAAAAAAHSRPATAVPSTGLADPRAPAPATAAAAAGLAAAGAARAPSPPRPATAAAVAPTAQTPPQAQPPRTPEVAAPPVARRPPAPAAPAMAARADPRAPVAGGQPPRAAAVSPLQGGRSVYAAKRSPGRRVALIVGALVLVAAVAALAVTLLGGSSGKKAPSASVGTTAATQHTGTHATRRAHHSASKAPTINPAETNVAVLNATEVVGLAARTASQLQQGGYAKASALQGKPPGTGQASVVEYTGGHGAEAQAVAHSVSVTHVLPIEAAVTALAGSANVVLIVGADKASP
jgi:LytR cell envelope-related transcriptional attenuator